MADVIQLLIFLAICFKIQRHEKFTQKPDTNSSHKNLKREIAGKESEMQKESLSRGPILSLARATVGLD